MRYKLEALIRSYMAWNTMFGEHVDDKEFCQLCRGDGVVCWNEDRLLCVLVHYYSSLHNCPNVRHVETNWLVTQKVHMLRF